VVSDNNNQLEIEENYANISFSSLGYPFIFNWKGYSIKLSVCLFLYSTVDSYQHFLLFYSSLKMIKRRPEPKCLHGLLLFFYSLLYSSFSLLYLFSFFMLSQCGLRNYLLNEKKKSLLMMVIMLQAITIFI